MEHALCGFCRAHQHTLPTENTGCSSQIHSEKFLPIQYRDGNKVASDLPMFDHSRKDYKKRRHAYQKLLQDETYQFRKLDDVFRIDTFINVRDEDWALPERNGGAADTILAKCSAEDNPTVSLLARNTKRMLVGEGSLEVLVSAAEKVAKPATNPAPDSPEAKPAAAPPGFRSL